MQDVHLTVINGMEAINYTDQLRRRTSFPVLQEVPADPLWSELQGDKDDFFVYDRCGRLTYYLPFPLSKLPHRNNSITRQVLLETYSASICGRCREDFGSEATETPKEAQNGSYQSEAQQAQDAITESKANPVESTELIIDPDESTELPTDTLDTTEGPSTSTTESLGWRVVHMVFGVGHRVHDVNNTREVIGQFHNDTTGDDEGIQEAKPRECKSVDKARCFDWPQERIQRVRRCCSGEVRSRRHCGRLTRRVCKKIHPLITCCPSLRRERDAKLSVLYQDIFVNRTSVRTADPMSS
ncbi:selenoprotein P-like isoform X2 [Ornithodoros turicata]|uniref:selenoprotein P-like isoform X2 n=1 Tax=Ornithodoros turicata TaxID=34597 RepID=UPI00313A11B4